MDNYQKAKLNDWKMREIYIHLNGGGGGGD